MNIYSKLHGTTSDRFRIGSNNQTITLAGETVNNENINLTDTEGTVFVVSSTVFFTAYIVGQGINNTAAYEIKGCYIKNTQTIAGYVVNTYVDNSNFTEPTIEINQNNELIVNVTGISGDSIVWSSLIDLVIV